MSPQDTWDRFARGLDFWGRASKIYGSYKATQLRALALRAAGKSPEELKRELWHPQHRWAGEQMFSLCVTLRGFYLKAGQFIGARADFVPEEICEQLSVLNDRVPPMSAEQTAAAIKRELNIDDLAEVFEWIELDEPLGSASIAQVHKARLRQWSGGQLKRLKRLEAGAPAEVVVAPGDSAWSICNLRGITLDELAAANRGVNIEALTPGTVVRVPAVVGLQEFQLARPRDDAAHHPGSGGTSIGGRTSASNGGAVGGTAAPPTPPPVYSSLGIRSGAAAAVAHALAAGAVQRGGCVAVKVQYPDAARVMDEDLVNLRAAAAFLSKTELKFDLVSAVDELRRQIVLEFDFTREARVMDTIHRHLRPMAGRVSVPRSVPGLVTPRVMVMTFMEGTPLLQARDRVASLPKWQRDKAKRLILRNLSEAYGRMILGEGLFQADGHPGNILVQSKGGVALLDYGQSKQLPPAEREAFARLVLAMHRGVEAEMDAALDDMGVVTQSRDRALRCRMAYGMFDTRGTVNPFDPNSPIKQSAISSFPPDMFFVLRVVQLLRGMAQGMEITGFSSADQWAPLAADALREIERRAAARRAGRGPSQTPDLVDLAAPLKLTV